MYVCGYLKFTSNQKPECQLQTLERLAMCKLRLRESKLATCTAMCIILHVCVRETNSSHLCILDGYVCEHPMYLTASTYTNTNFVPRITTYLVQYSHTIETHRYKLASVPGLPRTRIHARFNSAGVEHFKVGDREGRGGTTRIT